MYCLPLFNLSYQIASPTPARSTLYSYYGGFFTELHLSAFPCQNSSMMLLISSPTLRSPVLSRKMITSSPSLISIRRLLSKLSAWCTRPVTFWTLPTCPPSNPFRHTSLGPCALTWHLSLFHYTPWFLTPLYLCVSSLLVCLGKHYRSLEIQLRCHLFHETFPDNSQPSPAY